MPEPLTSDSVVSRCQCLRSKEMFVNVEPEGDRVSFSSGIFWCFHTQNCLGPDGQPADLQNCQPGRGCYEAI